MAWNTYPAHEGLQFMDPSSPSGGLELQPSNAPEVVPHPVSTVSPFTHEKEVLPDTEKEAVSLPAVAESRIFGLRRRNFGIVLAIGCLVVVAVVVGGGVGGVLSKRKADSASSYNSSAVTPLSSSAAATLLSAAPSSTFSTSSRSILVSVSVSISVYTSLGTTTVFAAAPSKAPLACQGVLGPCNTNGCQGINNSTSGLGQCTAGVYNGCNCSSVCGPLSPCSLGDCNGVNNMCTAGVYNGCLCIQCGPMTGPCDRNGCNGVNGFCTRGVFKGCNCY